jgi:YHS domain-containing protein
MLHFTNKRKYRCVSCGHSFRASDRRRVLRPPATAKLQQDPVCGAYVAVDSSLKRVVNGRVLHFCSPECRDKCSARKNLWAASQNGATNTESQ